MKHNDSDIIQCSRCPAYFDSKRGALSRADGTHKVCGSCSTDEAFYQMVRPGEPLPPLGQRATYWIG